MKVVFPIYHDMQFQSRPQECVAAMKLMGVNEIVMVTIAPWTLCPDGVRVILTKHDDALRYMHFYRTAIQTIKAENPDIVMLHDDFTAPILRWLIKHHFRGKIIFDESELYIDEKKKIKNIKDIGFSFLPYCEKKYLKKVDALIAANKERAEIMMKIYDLPQMPIILENMRRLMIEPDWESCDAKYGSLFRKNALTVLYGGGVKETRRTLELAEAVKRLGADFNLIITGGGDSGEIQKMKTLIESNPSDNIHYVGLAPRGEWKYLITKSDICVSIYDQNTYNNKYCASGRFYEGILEGIPVLATENPPMKNACNDFGFGVSTENLEAGLRELKNNYRHYKDNAKKFAIECKYEERIPRLAQQIEERLKEGETCLHG